MGEWRYNSTTLDVGTKWRWSASRQSRFTHGETARRYRSDRRLGGPQGRYGPCGGEKNVVSRRIRTPAVQTVARRYTERAMQSRDNSVPMTQKTLRLYYKEQTLMLIWEIMAVCSENHTDPIHRPCG
jgi:hypothetical protein